MYHCKYFRSVALLILCCLCVFPQTAAANVDGAWEYRLSPYAWLAGQNGSVATLPGLPPVDIDIDFWDDILGNINGALFLVGEARKDKWGVIFDLAYVDIETENQSPTPAFSTIDSTTTSWIVSAVGFYRLTELPDAFVDITAGVRYWSVESSLDLGPGELPGQQISGEEDWVDPLVGIKGFTMLGKSRFFCTGNAVIGGFGAGSDFMWDVSVNLGYQWGDTFSTTIGYRYLDVDYEEDGFIYDVAQQGPLVGLNWVF